MIKSINMIGYSGLTSNKSTLTLRPFSIAEMRRKRVLMIMVFLCDLFVLYVFMFNMIFCSLLSPRLSIYSQIKQGL